MDNLSEHRYDNKLSVELLNFLKSNNIQSILDLGSGPGQYAHYFEGNGINCDCYDGNPHTEELSNGKCKVLDLTERVNLNKKYDCVLSLEVGEHIPAEYERVFIENVVNHASKLIIISWAVVGQGGTGHVNEKPNEYVENVFLQFNWKRNKEAEKKLREVAELWWFRGSVLVFIKD
jgi:cyclopropane fatty-acyl-phospholipid synthase-like methyltransferase